MYRFKAFYKDGTTQIFGTPMDTPNELYFDFAPLIFTVPSLK